MKEFSNERHPNQHPMLPDSLPPSFPKFVSGPAAPRPNFATRPTNQASRTGTPAPPPPPTGDGSTPMELDQQGFPILTPEQKEARKKHRIQNGLCLYCGANTHRVIECPLVPSRRTSHFAAPPFPPAGVSGSEPLVADSSNYQ